MRTPRAGSRLAATLALPLLLAGCPRDEDGPAPAFTVLGTCVKAAQPAEQVFRSADEMRAFWSRHETRGGPPEVDFGRQVVAARFDGPGSACVGFSVQRVEIAGAQVVVHATRHVSTDPCVAVLAYPQLTLAIDRTELPVAFRIAQVQGAPPPGPQPCT